jgi:hypothetical protein
VSGQLRSSLLSRRPAGRRSESVVAQQPPEGSGRVDRRAREGTSTHRFPAGHRCACSGREVRRYAPRAAAPRSVLSLLPSGRNTRAVTASVGSLARQPRLLAAAHCAAQLNRRRGRGGRDDRQFAALATTGYRTHFHSPRPVRICFVRPRAWEWPRGEGHAERATREGARSPSDLEALEFEYWFPAWRCDSHAIRRLPCARWLSTACSVSESTVSIPRRFGRPRGMPYSRGPPTPR